MNRKSDYSYLSLLVVHFGTSLVGVASQTSQIVLSMYNKTVVYL